CGPGLADLSDRYKLGPLLPDPVGGASLDCVCLLHGVARRPAAWRCRPRPFYHLARLLHQRFRPIRCPAARHGLSLASPSLPIPASFAASPAPQSVDGDRRLSATSSRTWRPTQAFSDEQCGVIRRSWRLFEMGV